jgi:hypothetical protein
MYWSIRASGLDKLETSFPIYNVNSLTDAAEIRYSKVPLKSAGKFVFPAPPIHGKALFREWNS